MTKYFRRLSSALLGIAMSLAVLSCSDDKETAPVRIARLDRITYDYPTMTNEQHTVVCDSLAPELSALLTAVGLDTQVDNEAILAWADTQPVKIFAPLVEKKFPNLDTLEHTLGAIIDNADKNSLTIPHYRFASIVWGNPKSIAFVDTVALIALNHYLGPEHPAYANWPEYVRNQKRPELLPYDITEAIVATSHPYKPTNASTANNKPAVAAEPNNQLTADDIPDMTIESDGTLLNRLLYEGALVYAKTRLVPDADLASALGFSADQLRDVVANEEYTWNKIVAEKMLFSTDPELHGRLFNLLPNSAPISPQAPGRALRYIGLKIIQAYVDSHNDVKLDFLLSPEFYNGANTLREANYTPAKK